MCSLETRPSVNTDFYDFSHALILLKLLKNRKIILIDLNYKQYYSSSWYFNVPDLNFSGNLPFLDKLISGKLVSSKLVFNVWFHKFITISSLAVFDDILSKVHHWLTMVKILVKLGYVSNSDVFLNQVYDYII